ncbi:OmpA family protein [Vibrio hepatarius]|jgi:outer membrane protein OmpA-like peptidoglycan-associated protein|uniref:OmpA-like domain-containing protein n=1 Tax=Vibrio hepatarius TaxID=171383 RepID=A0A0M0I599_9VIBR|nr:OmpA family protein [Vibrio hepatarius]KOO09465.1 hypothetical protein AKJ31_03690 [Vibrio hepatarius]
MKYLALPLLVLLSGCADMARNVSNMTEDLLETAPKSDAELRYPEWGYAPQKMVTGIQPASRSMPVAANEYNDLQQFLSRSGVAYELLPGNHMMVKLKDTVNFNTGSSQVKADSAYWLNMLGSFLATQRGIDIVIDGHSDSTGAAKFNDGLSERRANAVKQQLVRNRVSKQSIFTRGYGEYVPACSNSTSMGKACNRRVELLLIVSDN